MNDDEAEQLDLALEAPEEDADPLGSMEHADAKDLVRVKRFPIDRLSVSEAITQVCPRGRLALQAVQGRARACWCLLLVLLRHKCLAAACASQPGQL